MFPTEMLATRQRDARFLAVLMQCAGSLARKILDGIMALE
jgi:hypothetical protein